MFQRYILMIEVIQDCESRVWRWQGSRELVLSSGRLEFALQLQGI